MNKREMITAITLSVLVFALWTAYEAWYQKHHPLPPVIATSTTQPSAQSVLATTEPTPAGPSTNPTIAEASRPTMTVGLHAIPATQPVGDISLGSADKDDPTYAMQLNLTPAGAGISDIVLNEFPSPGSERKKPKDKDPYRFESTFSDHPDRQVLATRTLVIDDKPVDLLNVSWTKIASDGGSATFSTQIVDAEGPLAEVTKTYHLPKRAETKDTSKGYEVSIAQTIRSLRPGKTLKVRGIINGPTPPPAEVLQGSDHTIITGYQDERNAISVVQNAFTDFKPDSPGKDLTQNGDKQHFAWTGQFSTYFAAIVQPDAALISQYSFHADALDPNAETNRNVAMTFETADMQVTPEKSATLAMTAYFGPKWREIVGTPYYAAAPRMYDQAILIKSGPCSFCTFPWLITALVWVLGIFHLIFRDWGLAIICLVLLVRAALHPITKRSQVQMMKMGKLRPEVEKLKAKYADQPEVLNREMMQIYKQQGGAMLGCLPMFLQSPIWIALWSALQSTFELRQAPFLYGLTWIKDLAKPDALINFGGPVKIIFFTIFGINILPILMAAVTYVNQKYFMPMPIAATPEQEQQQKMQRGMSLIFPLMFYGLPSGLNLYYLTSMSLGMLESKIIRDHIKEKEEAEKAGRVFVPVKATRAARRRDDRDDKRDEKPPEPGFAGRIFSRFTAALVEAQRQAEELKKQQQKPDGKKGRNN